MHELLKYLALGALFTLLYFALNYAFFSSPLAPRPPARPFVCDALKNCYAPEMQPPGK